MCYNEYKCIECSDEYFLDDNGFCITCLYYEVRGNNNKCIRCNNVDYGGIKGCMLCERNENDSVSLW